MISLPSFNELKKASKHNHGGKGVRVALLGDTPTQLLGQAIKGYAVHSGLEMCYWEADFNQIELQINNPDSELFHFRPDFIILFLSSEKQLQKFYKTPLDRRTTFAESCCNEVKALINQITTFTDARVILYSFYEIDDAVYGNFAFKTDSSFINQIRKLNLLLATYAQGEKQLLIADVARDYYTMGSQLAFAPNVYIQSGFVWSIDFLPYAAKRIIDIIQTQQGLIRKCLILDLDDTLWGGTVGDDGWQNLQLGDLGTGKAFTQLQLWIKELQMRGVIICVCSKNDDQVAREVFTKHPEMILREDDITLFIANWGNKVDNITAIKETLNISYSSIVFIDNSPFERNMVRSQIPELLVPELPEDPALYLGYLQQLNLFDTSAITDEDLNRTQQYKAEALRIDNIKHYANETEYLRNLNMVARTEVFNAYNIPRVAQLAQRSNQFNLRTIRYSEAELISISSRSDYITFAVNLKDKFGDYGLISVMIIRVDKDECFIDNWIMSCRVLKRGVEQFIMNSLIDKLKRLGIKKISAEYIPTKKNGLIKNLLSEMQFHKEAKKYSLDLVNYKNAPTEISPE